MLIFITCYYSIYYILKLFQFETRLGQIVYDISEHTGQKYSSLSDALGTNGNNVPEQYRKGGISIQYIDSDNKYIQCRYMSTATTDAAFVNTANWQGIDETPTAGSGNLVKSEGVYNSINLFSHSLANRVIKELYIPNVNYTAFTKISVWLCNLSNEKYWNIIRLFVSNEDKFYLYQKSFDTEADALADMADNMNGLYEKQGRYAILSVSPDLAGTNIAKEDFTINRDIANLNNSPVIKESLDKVSLEASIVGKEVLANKVSAWSQIPTDAHYPSEKLVHDTILTPLNSISKWSGSKNLFDKSDLEDKVVNTSGQLTTVSTYNLNKASSPIPINPNEYYCISGSSLAVGHNIRCLTADETPIKVLAPSSGNEYKTFAFPNEDGTSANRSLNGQFKTPATAVSVQFTVAAQNVDTSDTIMLEHIGSIYDPNFQPSPYEEYKENKLLINPDAIEMDKVPTEDSDNLITSGGVFDALGGIKPSAIKKLSVLLIGSSHGVNTISMFPVLAYHAGIDITVGNLYTGSATLGLHLTRPARQIPYMADYDVSFGRFAVYENGTWGTKDTSTISYALSEYKWDVIILQRGATENDWTDEKSAFYQHLLDYIKEHCNGYTPKIYFNSGIADPKRVVKSDDPDVKTCLKETNELMDSALQQKAEYGIDIIPTAVAVQYARETCLKETGKDLGSLENPYKCMCADSQHLDTGIGQYVTGCTVFEKIVGDVFNMSVRELAYYPVYTDISGNMINSDTDCFTPITDYYSRIAKQCAMLAVMDGEYVAEHANALNTKYALLPVTYSVTNNLTGCSNTNDAVNISSDDVYMCTLNVNSGLLMQSVVVTMGGVDVTSSVYGEYEGYYAIRIGVITGDIVISATAQ